MGCLEVDDRIVWEVAAGTEQVGRRGCRREPERKKESEIQFSVILQNLTCIHTTFSLRISNRSYKSAMASQLEFGKKKGRKKEGREEEGKKWR